MHWLTDSQSRLVQILCVAGATALFAGCSKSAHNAAASTPIPQTNASLPATESQPAQTVRANSASTPATTAKHAAPDLRPLNQALMGWVYQHGRRPADFKEFAASAGVKIPPPPSGKKYVINGRGLISLVNQ